MDRVPIAKLPNQMLPLKISVSILKFPIISSSTSNSCKGTSSYGKLAPGVKPSLNLQIKRVKQSNLELGTNQWDLRPSHGGKFKTKAPQRSTKAGPIRSAATIPPKG